MKYHWDNCLGDLHARRIDSEGCGNWEVLEWLEGLDYLEISLSCGTSLNKGLRKGEVRSQGTLLWWQGMGEGCRS